MHLDHSSSFNITAITVQTPLWIPACAGMTGGARAGEIIVHHRNHRNHSSNAEVPRSARNDMRRAPFVLADISPASGGNLMGAVLNSLGKRVVVR